MLLERLLPFLFACCLAAPGAVLACGDSTTAEARPIVVMVVTNPWTMVVGADEPAFVAYADGQVIYREKDEQGAVRHMDLGVAQVQWATLLARLDAQLGAQPFLLGEHACIADLAHYHPIWFVRSSPLLAPMLDRYEFLNAWMQRIADIGHGTPTPMSSADAVELARASEPAELVANDFESTDGIRVGQAVTVAATDYGVDPVAGTLVWQDHEEIVVERDDERAGSVHVHFPRIGFKVSTT